MKDFIKQIFLKNEMPIYKDYKCSEYDTLYAKESLGEAYYLNIFIKDKKEIIKFKDNYDLFYNVIKNMPLNEYQQAMDKNTTCVIYYCVSDEEYKDLHSYAEINELQKLVCDIEEDLYYFKKNVLVYSKKQLQYLKTISDFNQVCHELIGSRENFNLFKLNNLENFQYDLLINIFIKVPFLNYSKYFLVSGQTFKSVEDYIKEMLEIKKFGELKEKQCIEVIDVITNLDNEVDFDNWLDQFEGVIE